ncbi:MAG: Gfo/Idh/MocA family oxidoreductase [Alphaproteobacteria bacterium]|nr:Gfo/Idh/MocA family oxidoreductase [Alphaproteobacteria bacterium]
MQKNIAVIGCGYWGQNIVRSAADAGILYAVSDADPARMNQFAQQYSVKAMPFDAVLADAAVEGVMLAVPAPLHAPLALKAFAAGKHVFAEKPIALTVDDANLMIAAAQSANRILMVGHLLQYHPAFLELKRMVDGGQFGALQAIYSNRLNFGKIRTEENVFWSFAPHDVSMMLALAGREPTGIKAVYTAALPDSPLASTAHAHFDFGAGLTGHIHVSWLNPFKEQKLVLVGSSGMAVFDDTQPWEKKLAVSANRVSFTAGQPVLNKSDTSYVALTPSEPLKDECLHFAKCITEGTTPRTDGREALRVLKVMQACDKAAGA